MSDLISRQAVLDKIKEVCFSKLHENVVKGESDDSGRNTESGAGQDQGADGGC